MSVTLLESRRRFSNKERVLIALLERPRTNGELLAIGGIRYGGRVHELRHEQWDIITEHQQGGRVTYTLRGKVQPTQEGLPYDG